MKHKLVALPNFYVFSEVASWGMERLCEELLKG